MQSYIRHLKWDRKCPVAPQESASPLRHTIHAAGKVPQELSAYCAVGGTRLAMMVAHLVASGESATGCGVTLCVACSLVSWASQSSGGFLSCSSGPPHQTACDLCALHNKGAPAYWPTHRWSCCGCYTLAPVAPSQAGPSSGVRPRNAPLHFIRALPLSPRISNLFGLQRICRKRKQLSF
jgi:hypothetical protein